MKIEKKKDKNHKVIFYFKMFLIVEAVRPQETVKKV